MLFLPRDDQSKQCLGGLLIADEIVIDNKARIETDPAHFVEFLDNLFRLPGARAAAKGHDDVAELALKRTATRELDRPRRVAFNLEQIESWCRQGGHVGRLRLLEEVLVRLARGKWLNELGPGFIGFAGK